MLYTWPDFWNPRSHGFGSTSLTVGKPVATKKSASFHAGLPLVYMATIHISKIVPVAAKIRFKGVLVQFGPMVATRNYLNEYSMPKPARAYVRFCPL
ncbi:MAG: hypothetical protein LDLANPLL_02585 [Turneriella sp.]|nr:hypothetical protein [Turneriella sp.]